MKNGFGTRILSGILILMMLLSVVPAFALSAGAEDDPVVSDVPDFDAQFDADAQSVTTVDALEDALAASAGVIRIDADLVIDRSLYVTADTVIFTSTAHTLTRDPAFAGDLFVVGQDPQGTICEAPVRLSLGDPRSDTPDMLIIDGNKQNMTVDVNGSAFFVVNEMKLDVYDGVTVRNCRKTGNVRTGEKTEYGVSYPDKIGGSAMIICKDASVNILGGSVTGNESADYAASAETSCQGGAIYNFGKLYIYGGSITGNRGGRGGAIFNYRTLYYFKGTLSGNSSNDAGGAIYTPNSTGAYTWFGEPNDRIDDPLVIVENNTSGSYGAGIYANHHLSVKNTEFRGNRNEANSGGAIFASDMRVTVENSLFSGNYAKNNGGAINISGSTNSDLIELAISDTTFENNDAGGKGGAINIYEGARACLVRVNAEENIAKNGGFLFSTASTVSVYHSAFSANSSTAGGGAFNLQPGALTKIYASSFENNTAQGNGGALYIYPEEAETVVQDCSFTGNHADDGFGGAIYISNKGNLKFYDSSARNNSAKNGGFLYETTSGTSVTVAGATVSGNTATEGGSIVWGNTVNAKLYLDKAKYVDEDHTGDYDDEYWAGAIVNKLSVSYQTLVIPSYTDYDGTVVTPSGPMIDPNVSSSGQLERAIAAGLTSVNVVSDFTLDRTFYIPYDLTIRSDEAHTLTRAPGFAGDIFVIGETSDGVPSDAPASLTVGDPASHTEDLLIIDGNKDELTVGVTGTVFYVVTGSTLRLYENATVQNCLKTGNARTATNGYGVSYPEKVGGSVAILTNKSFMSVFGAKIVGNGVNEASVNGEDLCFQGGAIYNFGTLNIYGGLIENNAANAGGAIFNYRKLHIYGGSLKNNRAAESGGAVYMPNSASAYTWIGEENDLASGSVLFENNTAGAYGGAIYARNGFSAANATFRGNTVTGTKSGGAIACFSTVAVFDNVSFENNASTTYGGAVYFNGSNDKDDPEGWFAGCSFTENAAQNNGGALYLTSGARVRMISTDFTDNRSEASGGAIYMSASSIDINGSVMSGNTAATYGGAIYPNTSSEATLNNVTAAGNSASAGGFAYNKASSLTVYNSTLRENAATSAGGAVNVLEETDTKFYNTLFAGNTAGTNGGAFAGYSNEAPMLLHTCTFTGNKAENGFGGAIHITSKGNLTAYRTVAENNAANYGGFMYETPAGSVVTLVGLTVRGNTASTGGPIIWGNTFNAVLNIDKSQYTDLDAAGDYDDAYWAEAIKNKLTVNDISGTIPKYLDYGNEPYDNMPDALDVSSAAELEEAINAGVSNIRVVADFMIDRTFYITGETTIFSTIAHTLTRDPAFGGDIFVVGENEEGNGSLNEKGIAKLILGNPASMTENLLIIDGNDGGMTERVIGSVVFSVYSAHAEFYPNLTVRNCHKEGNLRTLDTKYKLSSRERVGGAVAAILGGELDIYGGNYIGNRVDEELPVDEETGETPNNASNGGSFYNYGQIRIYGGNFENSEGGRGGLIYTYRIVRIYAGTFKANHALTSGGVVYSPSVSSSHVVIGTGAGTNKAYFIDNYSDGNGGCLQISALAAYVILGNCEFTGNHAQGGAIACAYGSLTVRDSIFHDNYAASRGGAIYISNNKEEETTRIVQITGCTFENNISPRGGAIAVYASSADFPEGGVAVIEDCTFTGNRATSAGAAGTTFNGGAIHLDRKGSATLRNCVFTDNASDDEGGTLYAASGSKVNIYDSTFTRSVSAGNAGTISLHSTTAILDNVEINSAHSGGNGAAVYVSYTSACDFNSSVKATGCRFIGNSSDGYGGAFYATRKTVTEENRILDIRSCTFTDNASKKAGGAMYILADVSGYFADDVFENNSSETDGGAILTFGQIEMDTLTFTGNSCDKAGGALVLQTAANTAIYNTVFEGNTAGTNGGGAAVLTAAEGETILHGCTFTGNSAVLGGGVYATGASAVNMYSAVGQTNSADKGGFLYVTTTGTVFTLVGAEVSGNTAETGGPIIWGNSNGAVLNIDKAKFTDREVTGALDDAYFAEAIVNKLTVNEITGTVPTHKQYSGSGDKPITTPSPKPPVPVTDVFSLSQSSSDGYINAVYDAFGRLDNSSNFMSTATKVFSGINGGDVTVDTYVYHTNTTTQNMNVGVGLMIYQAMRYKEAHPTEEVCIDISAYRFSVQTAVNINRQSRYFGYVRQLSSVEYDQFGFVRISYLLVSAAKMGIRVNAIGHLDAYPSTDGGMVKYFRNHAGLLCDPAYVEDGTVGDYLKFTACAWTLDGKGGTDMMHTKLCAVSHYLDMNGVEHRNAVWTSSSNLDGTTDKGYNANWKLQTATIVSDHEEIYRVSTNYLRLIAQYSGQEQIYVFRDLVNARNTEQANMILEGRYCEIPADERVIYLGTPEDDVFELYFSPFGGGVMCWDELNNPYCKYVRKLYDSEGYIRFAWSVAEYSGNNPINRQIVEMVSGAFHKNRDVENKLFVVAGDNEDHDGDFRYDLFDDLAVGTDIGYKYYHVNNSSAPCGFVHNKDVLLSYVENGQRYYVSLLNSLNVHSGSMYYQSNQALVIKEKDCSPDNVFSVLAREFTKGDIVTHDLGEETTVISTDPAVHSRVSRFCAECGYEEIVSLIHEPGDWIVDREATASENGLRHTACVICGKVIDRAEFRADPKNLTEVAAINQNGVAILPEGTQGDIEILSVPAKVTDITQILDGRKVSTLILQGLSLNEESVEAIARSAPITVFCSRKAGETGLYETLGQLPGVTVKDILSVDGRTCYLFDEEMNKLRVIVKINANDIDFDNTKLILIFMQPGAADKTLEVNVNTVYSTVRGVASTDPSTAATQGILYIEGAMYLFAVSINNIPDGVYTLHAEISAKVGDVEIIGKPIAETTVRIPGEAVQGSETNDLYIKDLYTEDGGRQPSAAVERVGYAFENVPLSYEFVYKLPSAYSARAGVLFGTYTNGTEDQLNVEVYTDGKLRLWYKVNGTSYTATFSADIRSDEIMHLALTVDGLSAKLYLNGVLTDTVKLTKTIPSSLGEFCVGGDFRANNAQYFKGVIYAVNVFDTVRTNEQIAEDYAYVSPDTEGLIYTADYSGV